MGYLHCGRFVFMYHRGWALKYPQAVPEAKKWRNTPFYHYDDFQVLTEGRYATGECAYRVSLTSDNENNDITPTKDVDVDDDVAVSQSTDNTSQVS